MSTARRGALALAIALGSLVGGTGRWLAAEGLHAWLGREFPWGTLFVNVSGSFAIGLCAGLMAIDARFLAGAASRHFVITGICGGYTTFSIFSLETLRLLEAGRTGLAGLNVGVSLAAWLAAVWLGYVLGARIPRTRGAT